MLELKNCCYSYQDTLVLDHISIKINQGDSVAVMGANGCGKSTLLKVINGLVTVDEGQYIFQNEEITYKRLQDNSFSKRFHQKIGFVFQNPETQLFCSTVWEEIAFGPRQMGLIEEEIEKRVWNCLNLLQIEKLKDKVPYHLSGGEKKKVAIACVMVLNPEVIVFDEPMNGLDPKTQRWLVGFLQILQQAGKTLIISTHNLELVSEISTRSILFDESHKIVADQDTKSVLQDIDLLKKVNLVDPNYSV